MTPGSYTLIRGNVVHVSSCAPGGPECIAFLTQNEPFGFKLAPARDRAGSGPTADSLRGQ